jgi:hypothetical protein
MRHEALPRLLPVLPGLALGRAAGSDERRRNRHADRVPRDCGLFRCVHVGGVPVSALLERRRANVPLRRIIRLVADHYGYSIEALTGRRRTYGLSQARHVAMFLCRHYTDLSLADIGLAFDRDHSTVIHGVNRIQLEIRENRALAQHVVNIGRQIQSGSAVAL